MADNKYYHGEITSDSTDWGVGDASTDNKPCGGDAVQGYIKRKFSEKAGYFYYDQQNGRYLVFSDESSKDLYLSDPETYSDLVIGSFDAPSNYTAEMYVTTPAQNTILKGKTGNYIEFTFDIKTKNGTSTGDSVTATFTFSSAGNVRTITQICNAGQEVRFLVDPYLMDGRNTITVGITGRSTKASTSTVIIYTVVALSLTSTFDFSTPIPVGGILDVPYVLEGSGTKYLEWYVNGNRLEEVDTITELKVDRIKHIDISNFAAGIHTVQFRAYVPTDGTYSYGETLYFDFVVASVQSDLTEILFGLTLDEPKVQSGNITLTATQFETLDYNLAVYDGRGRVLPLTISDNGTQIQSISTAPNTIYPLSYTPTTAGNHNLTFVCGQDTVTIGVVVDESDIGINETTDAMVLKLSAKGRSNSETRPNTWTYGDVTTTFHGIAWNNQSGWIDNALVIPAGGSIDINYSPLSGDPEVNGRTIEIDLETSDVKDDNATILSLINPSSNAGLAITASTAQLRASGGASIDTKYGSGERIHLAFIINKVNGDDALLMFIVNNGILERVANFTQNDQFSVSQTMHIGSSSCVVKIHSIRVYNKNLSVDEAFGNYAFDSDNIVQIADANDIFDDTTGAVDADKVNAKIPVMIITGNIDDIIQRQDKNYYNPYPVRIEYRDMADSTKNFVIENANIRLQGTTSIEYPRKNFRIYSSKGNGKFTPTMTDGQGNVVEGGKWSFHDGATPVTCWCLKADYAESSGSHNTGVARIWNNLMYNAFAEDSSISQQYGQRPLRTAAQTWAIENSYPYDVRTTIDGHPIVLFQHNSDAEPLICFGQYNFNNDKSTEDVYGFTKLKVGEEEFDNSNVQCFECLDSSNNIALFKDLSQWDVNVGDGKKGWEEAFEERYSALDEYEGKTDVRPLYALASWINSCKNNQAKWNSEKGSHFDLPKLCAYYVYLLRFGAVDQTVKNSMITTEDGVHWFYINYDNDTIFGINNRSVLFNTWDYGLKSTIPTGGYYYAGNGESVLWNCFEADTECMALARKIDMMLFNAGLQYAKLNEMFDDKQTEKWCERIYNINGRFKYIQSFVEQGAIVLYMLQGRRQSHRHWYLRHRLEKYDNLWGTGTYTSRRIALRTDTTFYEGTQYSFVPAITSNYGYAVGSTEVDAPQERTADVTYTSTGLPARYNVGVFVYIYNANDLKVLDLSIGHNDVLTIDNVPTTVYVTYLTGLSVLDLTAAINEADGSTELQSIILGDGTHENNLLSDISGLSFMRNLQTLDIRGFKAITSLSGLASLQKLSTFNAANSGLTSFEPAAGLSLTSVTLPNTLTSFTLIGSSVTSLTYTPTSSLLSFYIDSCTGVDERTRIETWRNTFTDYENRSLTLRGVHWTGVDATWLCDLADPEVSPWKKFEITGTAQLTSIDYAKYNRLIDVFGASCFNQDAVFHITLASDIYLFAPDSFVEGETVILDAIRFPYEDGTYTYTLLATDDAHHVALNGNVITSDETGQNDGQIQVQVSFTRTGTITPIAATSKTIDVLKATYPSPSQVTLTEEKIDDHEYHYSLSYANTFTGHLQATWSFVSENGMGNIVSITPSQDGLSAVLTVGNLPSGTPYMSGHISAALKKATGDSIGTKNGQDIALRRGDIAITDADNHYLMDLMYRKGFSADSQYMTIDECALVQASQLQTGSSYSTSIFYADSNFRTYCTHFDEFKYFTGISGNIPSYLFYSCNLQSITLPASPITTGIGSQTFYNCTSLTTINYNDVDPNNVQSTNIPSGYTSIGYAAFQLTHITEVTFPSTLTSISECAFQDCSSLTSVDIPASVTYLGRSTSGSGWVFRNCTGLTSAILRGGVTILYRTFQGCSSLASVTIPNSVTTIDLDAFEGCALTTVTIPQTVTKLGIRAFARNPLTSIYIPASVTAITENPFLGCSSLTSIEVDANNTAFSSPNNCNAIVKYSGSNWTVVSGCSTTTYPTSGTGTLGTYSFSELGITSITTPTNVSKIDTYAFYRCRSLASVTFSEGLSTISSYAFNECSSLGASSSIVFPSTLRYINSYAFKSTGITSITIPSSVSTPGDNAFASCTSLTSATVMCANLGELAGYGVFESCTNLTQVTFSSNVKTIGSNTFKGCTKLGTGGDISIPASVTKISNDAFRNIGVNSAHVLGTTPAQLGTNVFIKSGGTMASFTIYVPTSAVSSYNSASGWSSYIIVGE